MTTKKIKTLTPEQLNQEIDRLWNVYNTTWQMFRDFSESINKASTANVLIGDILTRQPNRHAIILARDYMANALRRLADIEDAIRRYREHKPQEYETEP